VRWRSRQEGDFSARRRSLNSLEWGRHSSSAFTTCRFGLRSRTLASTLNIQLWSYNFAPEPIGIGPVSTTWADAMADRGHEVEVVAAHPHYPSPQWGFRLRPYRERRRGVPVLRLPIWVGRDSTRERLRQEASFAVAQLAVLPLLRTPDAVVSVSPCFFALGPAMLNVAARRLPWILWLQDLLPDAAANTGLLLMVRC